MLTEHAPALPRDIDFSRKGLPASPKNTETVSIEEIFFAQVRQYPILSREQERLLFGYMKSGMSLDDVKGSSEFSQTIKPKDRERFYNVFSDSRTIKDVLVGCNLLLVALIAQRYRGHGFSLLDLVQEGTLGLMHAIDKFDLSREKRLSTYADSWIRQTTQRAIMDKASIIRLPIPLHEAIRRTNKTFDRLAVELGREPTSDEVHERVNGKHYVATSVYGALKMLHVASLDMRVSPNSDTLLGDLIPDKDNGDSQRKFLDHVEGAEIRDKIKRWMRDNLTLRQQEVINYRYDLNGEGCRTLEQVGERMGITRQRVEQLQKRVLQKMSGDQEFLQSLQ